MSRGYGDWDTAGGRIIERARYHRSSVQQCVVVNCCMCRGYNIERGWGEGGCRENGEGNGMLLW